MRSKIHKDLFQDRQNKMLGNENMLQAYIKFLKNLKQVFFISSFLNITMVYITEH